MKQRVIKGVFFYQGETVAKQNGEANTDVKDEIPSRKDSVNEIIDIEEAVPNETEDKTIDKQKQALV